jgi:membrane associated rhomboid family serine protease
VPAPDLSERIRDFHPLEARVTITLWVTSLALSLMDFGGAQFDFLVPSAKNWPGTIGALFTACLLHGDGLHLFFNLVMTWRLGVIAEGLIGSAGLGFFVVLCGFGSGAIQWAFSGPYVGLSGIVYGIFGLLWALDRWHPQSKGFLNPGATRLMVGWFFFCILLTQAEIWRVANLVHGFGALLGVIFGWSLSKRADQRGWRWFAFPGATLVCVLIPLLTTPKPIKLDRAWSALGKGNQALESDQPQAAEAHFREALEHYDLPGAHWNLSIALRHLGRAQEAAREQDLALEMDPSLDRLSNQQEQ